MGEARPARAGPYAAVGLLLLAILTGATLPSPLYGFWERRYGFGAIVTTLIFSIYAVAVMLALLFAGRASDVIGRRPVLVVCLVLSVISSVLFLFADGLVVLFLGRFVSGLSVGLAVSAGTATLVDLAGGHRFWAGVVPGVVTLAGLGCGAVLGGLLAQLSAGHVHLPFVVHLALLAVTAGPALWVAGAAESAPPVRARAFVHRPALGLPGSGRGTFAAAALGGSTTFALLGLFASLVPTFLSDVVHEHHPLVLGATVSLLLACAVVSQLAVHRLDPRLAVTAGLSVLVIGLAVLAAGLDVASLAVFVAGTVVAGAGFGAAFSGGLRTALGVAGPDERGRVSALFFLLAYGGLAIPSIGVGIGITEAGFLPAFFVAGGVLAAIAVGVIAYLGTHPGRAP